MASQEFKDNFIRQRYKYLLLKQKNNKKEIKRKMKTKRGIELPGNPLKEEKDCGGLILLWENVLLRVRKQCNKNFILFTSQITLMCVCKSKKKLYFDMWQSMTQWRQIHLVKHKTKGSMEIRSELKIKCGTCYLYNLEKKLKFDIESTEEE